jgi:hypothetical protein
MHVIHTANNTTASYDTLQRTFGASPSRINGSLQIRSTSTWELVCDLVAWLRVVENALRDDESSSSSSPHVVFDRPLPPNRAQLGNDKDGTQTDEFSNGFIE